MGENLLLQQRGKTFEVRVGLLPHGRRLFDAGLDFARINCRELFTRLHLLTGHDEHLAHLAADLGFDDRAQFRTHRADDFFGGDALFAFNGLDADRGGRKR